MTATTPKERTGKLVLALIGFILFCNAVGGLSALVGNMDLYQRLVLPEWAPPGYVFGPVWTLLYTLMGITTWMVWRAPRSTKRNVAFIAFALHLIVNAAWTPVFFGLEAFGVALFVIFLVWATALAMMTTYFRVQRVAGWLTLPLLLWVSFASALNAAVWVLNAG